MGGATAGIFDPSRNISERKDLQNIAGIRDDIEQVMTKHEQNFWKHVKVVDNESRYSLMNIVDFLSSVGRNLRIGTIRTSVKAWLES